MSPLASQITRISIVYSTVCSDGDHRKHQSSASLAFVRGIHRWPVNSPHKGPVTRKMFPFDDVIVVSAPVTIYFGSRLYTVPALDRVIRNKVLYRFSFLSHAEFCATRSIHEMKLTKNKEHLGGRKPPPYLIWEAWNSLVKHEAISPIVSWDRSDKILWKSIHAFSVMLLTNRGPENKTINPMSKRLNATSPNCLSIFPVSYLIRPILKVSWKWVQNFPFRLIKIFKIQPYNQSSHELNVYCSYIYSQQLTFGSTRTIKPYSASGKPPLKLTCEIW